MKKMTALLLCILLLFPLSACTKKEEESQEKKANLIHAKIEVEHYGTITVELYPDVAPKTVENFVKLANEGFYTNSSFHRIIDGFMIQGGINPEKKADAIEGEFTSNGFENNLKHTPGVISMARTSEPNSASSQFFIMVGDADWLDGNYAAFGKVTENLDAVYQIAKDAKPIDNNGTILPEEQPKILSVTIID